MIYDCCVRQKKCRSILKHVLKRCDNRKSCRRPVVSLSHATKLYRVNRPNELANAIQTVLYWGQFTRYDSCRMRQARDRPMT